MSPGALTSAVLAAAVVAGAAAPAPSPRPTAAPGKPAKASPAPSPTASASPSPAGHVFTNEDLPAQPSPAAVASPGPAGTGRGTVTVLPKTAGPSPTPKPVEKEYDETEPFWRAQAESRRGAITAAEQKIADLENRITALRNDLSPTNVMDANREQSRQAQITQAMADLEGAKAELEAARQALADFEEGARRKGIPPGWLR